MKLSKKAIELCRMKLGNRGICGFEYMQDISLYDISEESAKRDFYKLMESGMIDCSGDKIHISALGQHIFNMMSEPEQYVMLENTVNCICARLYIRNCYYLCVIEDKKIESDEEYDKYTFELLPRLDLVVGLFAYVLHHDENTETLDSKDGRQVLQDIRIIGKAWDKGRKIISENELCGNYHNEEIHYKIKDEINGNVEVMKSDTCELINKLTGWMFEKIALSN